MGGPDRTRCRQGALRYPTVRTPQTRRLQGVLVPEVDPFGVDQERQFGKRAAALHPCAHGGVGGHVGCTAHLEDAVVSRDEGE